VTQPSRNTRGGDGDDDDDDVMVVAVICHQTYNRVIRERKCYVNWQFMY
jgi:hypothetical protein